MLGRRFTIDGNEIGENANRTNLGHGTGESVNRFATFHAAELWTMNVLRGRKTWYDE